MKKKIISGTNVKRQSLFRWTHNAREAVPLSYLNKGPHGEEIG